VERSEHRNKGKFGRNIAETSSSTTVSTKLQRIAKLARAMPQAALTTLAHRIDIDWLRGNWLNAGVMEEGAIEYPQAGTPQGGVISPILANIYLHEVLDDWFARQLVPRLAGRATLVRFADDLVIIFEYERDARRVSEVLPKRPAKFGLTLHPEKTRLIDFRRPDRRVSWLNNNVRARPDIFDLLGFTHYWAVSRKGYWVVKQKTAADRFRRTLKRIADWCQRYRHEPVPEQWAALRRKLLGHFAYFGITGNFKALRNLRYRVIAVWRKWLSRRSQRAWISWEAMMRLLARHPLPEPHIRPPVAA
jgi:hypothetical protein